VIAASAGDPSAVRAWLWPLEARAEVADALARAAGIARPAPPEWFQVAHDEIAGDASRPLAAPACYAVEPATSGEGGGWLSVLAQHGSTLRVLRPDGSSADLPLQTFVRLVCGAAEARVEASLGDVVERAHLPPDRTAPVREALLRATLAGERVAEGWRVGARPPTLGAALRDAGLARRLALAALAYGAELSFLVFAWWMVGARATGGRAGRGGVAAWLAVLALFVAARSAASWAAGRLAVDGGRLLRARLMEGLLALDTEPLRAEGVGRLLGRVMETESVESLALGGGLLGVAGLFELATGVVILALGARGPSELAFFALVLLGATVLAAGLWRALGRWSELRLGLTYDLVERMAGHRTLVVQQAPELRHRGEDAALAAYDRARRAADGASAVLGAAVPRAWLLLGVVTLAPALASAGTGAGLVATALGGVLFVHGALRKLTQAFPALATAAVAWRQVAPLFVAAPDHAPLPPRAVAPGDASSPPGAALVAARDVGFRYPDRATPALIGCSFEIRRGDRVLLEGPSGGGKSTLASLIAGLRAPGAGALALDGVDQTALGLAGWRERVGVVPQFHENHVFSASMLFNLLMGRAWPPRAEDVALARTLCQELDLGGVLDRMPSGLEQLVGESGWQLSHGERSRLFIARALLQRLDLRVLDESFAALDPETLERVLDCVLKRAETLLVIAHP
jgi:ABC-type multidrug transport system fused ATPase/permease subunit